MVQPSQPVAPTRKLKMGTTATKTVVLWFVSFVLSNKTGERPVTFREAD
jgi:hypothetical protein